MTEGRRVDWIPLCYCGHAYHVGACDGCGEIAGPSGPEAKCPQFVRVDVALARSLHEVTQQISVMTGSLSELIYFSITGEMSANMVMIFEANHAKLEAMKRAKEPVKTDEEDPFLAARREKEEAENES